MDENESCNVEVRRIDNGYVLRESKYCGGKYESKEVFSRNKPNLAAGGLDNGSTTSAMREALKELNRK